MSDPARSLDRARDFWRQHGRSEKWIQQRMMGQETRNKLRGRTPKPGRRAAASPGRHAGNWNRRPVEVWSPVRTSCHRRGRLGRLAGSGEGDEGEF
jgi:hypothetical protein